MTQSEKDLEHLYRYLGWFMCLTISILLWIGIITMVQGCNGVVEASSVSTVEENVNNVDWIPDTEKRVTRLLSAIYKAEGGTKTKYPYGIRSVTCDSIRECRKVCRNTIVNNIGRYRNYGHKTHDNYISFLASRYAPVNASNDPGGLNKNWEKNVRFFLTRDM